MRQPMTPSRVLEEYDIIGRRIPKSLINEMCTKFKQLEEQGTHPWKILCNEVTLSEELQQLNTVERKIARDRLWVVQGCAEVMLMGRLKNKLHDSLSWKARLSPLENPMDYHRMFEVLNVDDSAWKKGSDLVLATCQSVVIAIQKKYGSYPFFVAWMEGKDVPRTMVERVNSCKSKRDFLNLFDELGIPEGQWKSSKWLQKIAKLPQKQGGIKIQLYGLYKAIHKRFESHPQFVAWMDGRKEPQRTFVQIVSEWKSSGDAKEYFGVIGVPWEKWRSSSWMDKIARRSRYEEGIDKNLKGLVSAIHKRFGSHPQFVAAMDSRLPFDGFTSSTQAQQYLCKEILRLRESGDWIQAPTKGDRITKEELDEIARPEYYKKNPVVRAVADYLNSQKQDS